MRASLDWKLCVSGLAHGDLHLAMPTRKPAAGHVTLNIMGWEDFRDALQTRVQDDHGSRSKTSAIAAMGRLSILAGIFVAALLIPATTFVAVTSNNVAAKVLDMPLALKQTPNPQTSRILAKDGSLIAYFYEENREDVKLDKISDNMKDALISIEDSRFYEHGALDLKGTLRALANNASEGHTQGGSTLTQQLVKMILVQQATSKDEAHAATKKSIARKVRELKYAIGYEQAHSKDDILERYLNTAYFGDGSYGINSAAYHYFSVSPDDLSLDQAATIAGLVKNPTEFDPQVYPERALQRRNTVLSVMARQGKISASEAQDLQSKKLGLKVTDFPNGCVTSDASFSCDYIREYLLADQDLGKDEDDRRAKLERGGLTVKSNIDVRMQKAVNDAVKKNVDATDKAIGAMALVEPGTGNVRGLAQSRPMGTETKKGESFINFSVPSEFTQSGGFQAGSTFKIFTVAAALKKNIPVGKSYNSPQDMTMPAGTFKDCSGNRSGPWEVRNSTGSGNFNMYTGTRKSVNTYFAQLERDAGLCNTVKMAKSMGIDVPHDPDKNIYNEVPAFTLGSLNTNPLDMSAAYATAASGGKYCKPQPINEILDSNGDSVKKYKPECKHVMSKKNAAQVNDILKGLQQPGGFGFQNGTSLSVPSAGKTGTTNDNKAVWYMGYTPDLVASSMIAGANKNGKPIPLSGQAIKGRHVSPERAAGSALTGPMWKDAMGTIQEYLPGKSFASPPHSKPAPPQKPRSSSKKKDDDDNDDNDDDD